MKKLIFTLVLVLGIAVPLVMAGDNNSISYDQLPSGARNFIEKMFPGIKVVKCEREMPWTRYDVKLANGYELEFDRVGQWLEIEAETTPFSPVLLKLIPTEAVSYVNTQHQESDIKKIERKKNGYKVKVDNKHVSSNIHFDKSGKWKKTEHDD